MEVFSKNRSVLWLVYIEIENSSVVCVGHVKFDSSSSDVVYARGHNVPSSHKRTQVYCLLKCTLDFSCCLTLLTSDFSDL